MNFSRRQAIIGLGAILATGPQAFARKQDPKIKLAVTRALDYMVRTQKRQGFWEANTGQYRVAMTALAGTALLCEGSTTSRGKYAKTVRAAVSYLLDMSRPNGLIGYEKDYRYTYGHGFSMLFLSQVFGEEESAERRGKLKRALTKAVDFSGKAQTKKGGWGYVSAKDGNQFDEGSTCITQVQGLRACRNAGIPVPIEIINKAKKYIKDCTGADGGVVYSIGRKGGGGRPPITAAAVAAMYSSGEYDNSDHIKKMLTYCSKNVWPNAKGTSSHFGHWHYAHYYFAQAMYRDPKQWEAYFRDISSQILPKQSPSGAWKEGNVGPIYTTAINATILQLENGYLPIYQR